MNHDKILKEYVDTDMALHEYIKDGNVNFDRYMELDLIRVIAESEYIKSLEIQGYSAPYGMKERNLRGLQRHNRETI